MTSHRARAPLRAAAAFGLTALLGALALPLLGLVIADERTPVCCGKGRCCCADDAAGRDDRTCLRRGCGCERHGEAVTGAMLETEAILPASEALAAASPRYARWPIEPERPLPRSEAPPVPPPRRPLPA